MRIAQPAEQARNGFRKSTAFITNGSDQKAAGISQFAIEACVEGRGDRREIRLGQEGKPGAAQQLSRLPQLAVVDSALRTGKEQFIVQELKVLFHKPTRHAPTGKNPGKPEHLAIDIRLRMIGQAAQIAAVGPGEGAATFSVAPFKVGVHCITALTRPQGRLNLSRISGQGVIAGFGVMEWMLGILHNKCAHIAWIHGQ